MTRFRFSELASFHECPFRYRKTVVEGHRETVPAFENGRLLHRAIQEYGEHCYRTKRDVDESRARTIAASLPGDVQNNFLYFAGMYTWDFEGALLDPTGKLFETEHSKPITDEWELVGHVDYLRLQDGLLEIIDWKSGGWRYADQPEVPTLQLLTYALLLVHEKGDRIEQISARQQFVSGLVWSWEIDFFVLPDVERLQRERMQAVASATEWPANPGRHCTVCTCRSVCPGPEVAYCEDAEDDAVAEVALYYKSAHAAADTEMRRRVEERGPIIAAGMKWGYPEGQPRYEPKDPVAYSEARATGKRKPWGHASWSQSALRKDAENPALKVMLKEKPPQREWKAVPVAEDATEAAQEEGEQAP